MAHDVFISYSSKDKTMADAVTAKLEAAGIRCWIAPRDILPGQDWGEAIIVAIEESEAMVLVFSQHANESVQIKREVERAVHKGHPIIPLRIEDVQPTKSLEYFISSQHWLDALTPNIDGHLNYLAETVNLLLSRTKNEKGQQRTMPKPPQPARPLPPQTLTPMQLLSVLVFLLLGFFGYRHLTAGNPDMDSYFEGIWRQENQSTGFYLDVTIDDDGGFKDKILLEEKGDFSYDGRSLRINGFGGQRLTGWDFVGTSGVKAVGLIPNNLWAFVSFASPQAGQGNEIYKVATEAVFKHVAGPGQAPRYPTQQIDRYEFNTTLGGIAWALVAEFGPGNKYRFSGTMEDAGKFHGKDGHWTFASNSGNVSSGTYQIIDKSTVSMTSMLGAGVWKRQD